MAPTCLSPGLTVLPAVVLGCLQQPDILAPCA